MKNINWKVRFSKNNLMFIVRFIGALLVPVMAYMGINYEDLNTWSGVGTVILGFISNPYLVGLTIINGIIMIPDPTTPGIVDSKKALGYSKPGGDE